MFSTSTSTKHRRAHFQIAIKSQFEWHMNISKKNANCSPNQHHNRKIHMQTVEPNAFQYAWREQNIDKHSSKSQSNRNLNEEWTFLKMQIVYQTNAIIWKCTCRPSSQMLFNMIECAFARRPSIQMCFLCAQMCSRSMPNDSNAYLSCANNAFARCLSLHMHFLYVEIWFRSTPADPNAFPLCSNVLSPDAC